MSALPNNTFASPGNAYYALRGEIVGAQEWWKFPSQNGEIQLIDSSGTQLLQSIAGNLFYNNELLAKAGDISDIADWSFYPALTNVNMNGQSLTDVSSAVINNNTTTNSLLVTNGITSQANIIAPTLQIIGQPVPNLGQITTQTLTASGAVQAGSISSGGAVAGGSLATTGGLDMTNSGITRAASVGISNAGAGPYGSLTSPDGVMLTWNGATITTGAGGNASQWANYTAVNNVNMGGSNITNAQNIFSSLVESTTVSAGVTGSGKFVIMNNNSIAGSTTDGLTVSSQAGQPLALSSGSSLTETANAYTLTVDKAGTLSSAQMNLTAQNGSGGAINVTANAGTGVGPAQVGFGTVQVNALGANNGLFNLGGQIDITAYSGGLGEYGGATSRVSLSAATLALSAGAAPALPGLAGSMNVFGQGAVSIVASVVPPVLPQFPETVYLYGLGIPGTAGGVRMESPNGIQMLSDTYIENLYPLDGNGLTIQGRAAPTGYVTIQDCANLTMTSSGTVTTDKINSVSSNGIFYADSLNPLTNQGVYTNFLKPPQASAPGVPNLIISNNPFLGNTNYVDISGASTIAFDATGTGALLGVQSINGAAWPPATGDASLWSQYPATSVIDVSGYGLIRVGDLSGVTSINGSAYPPASTTPQWATFPAVQTVDMSSNGLINVNDISMVAGSSIIGTTLLTMDVSGDLSLFTNGGGEINLSTGSEASIGISALGTGNSVNISADSVALNAIAGVSVSAPFLNMLGNDISGVKTIKGVGGTTALTIQNTGTGGTDILDLSGGVFIASQFAPVTLSGGTRVQLNTNTGPINLVPQGGAAAVNLLGNTVVGTVGVPKSLTVYGTVTPASITDASGSTGTLNQILTADGGNALQWASAASLSFVYSNTIFVDPNGSDVTGNGGISNPYQTLTKAITVRNSLPDTTEISIFVAAGTYNESPTITKSNTFLCGFNSSGANKSSVNIVGVITVNITATTAALTQVVFSDFQITGQISFPATNLNQATQYSFENIDFINAGNSPMISILNAGGFYDPLKTTAINNCVFNSSATGAGSVVAQRTTITITNSQFINTLTAPCIQLSYAAICYARFSSFINTSSNTGCQALIQFTGTYTNTTLFPSIENCIMRYYSSATDVGGNKCCIQFGIFGGTTVYQAQLYNNTMYCEGAVTGSPLIQAVQRIVTGGAVTVIQLGNSCGVTANNLAPTITKITGNTLT
jgi:hypothetical protein